MIRKISTFIKGNKKIVLGVMSIAVVAALAIGGTVAYFSDTEISAGNTFKAGKLNLKIDSTCHYNGRDCVNGKWGDTDEACACNWEEKDLAGELFFNLNDVKPGDTGEDTISLHVINNDAWMCAEFTNLKNYDNGCESPESPGDTTCGNPGEGQGELQDNLFMTVWKDTDCDNILDTGTPEIPGFCSVTGTDTIGNGSAACPQLLTEVDCEFEASIYGCGWTSGTPAVPAEQILADNQPAASSLWPIADASTAAGPFKGDETYCLGVSWTVPLATSNIIQTDSLVGDFKFTAVQARNMPTFLCSSLNPTEIPDPECVSNTDCDDANTCTTDTCDPAGVCQHENNANSCDDGVYCNGPDTCSAGSCSLHPGNPCPTADGDSDCSESCDESADQCTADDPDGSACLDGACQAGICELSCTPTAEVCDTIDNDCDDLVDEGVTTTFYRDSDIDGYGNPGVSTQACSLPAGYSTNWFDCNDSNPLINPLAIDIPVNGIDENCDGKD